MHSQVLPICGDLSCARQFSRWYKRCQTPQDLVLAQRRQPFIHLGFYAIICRLIDTPLFWLHFSHSISAQHSCASSRSLSWPYSMDGPVLMGTLGKEDRLKKVSTTESYTFQNQEGWRRWRILRPGRGMYHDVKRRLPYYWTDITDAFTYRVFASTIRMYFIKSVKLSVYSIHIY